MIVQRAQRWHFTYLDKADRPAHDSVRADATFIRKRLTGFPALVTLTPIGITVLAINVDLHRCSSFR